MAIYRRRVLEYGLIVFEPVTYGDESSHCAVGELGIADLNKLVAPWEDNVLAHIRRRFSMMSQDQLEVIVATYLSRSLARVKQSPEVFSPRTHMLLHPDGLPMNVHSCKDAAKHGLKFVYIAQPNEDFDTLYDTFCRQQNILLHCAFRKLIASSAYVIGHKETRTSWEFKRVYHGGGLDSGTSIEVDVSKQDEDPSYERNAFEALPWLTAAQQESLFAHGVRVVFISDYVVVSRALPYHDSIHQLTRDIQMMPDLDRALSDAFNGDYVAGNLPNLMHRRGHCSGQEALGEMLRTVPPSDFNFNYSCACRKMTRCLLVNTGVQD